MITSDQSLLQQPTFFSEKHFFVPQSPLQLVKQTSSSQERISINGLQKNVHVVVKNAAFIVQLALANSLFDNHMLDLNKFTFDAMLLYDSEGEKYVDYVKIKPVECKPTINEVGNQVSLELRIKVLTSQHENSFFRVKIFILDPATGLPYHPAFTILSEPVKVISKPEQMKKKPPMVKKRNINDILVETISRIEEQQRDTQKFIESMIMGSDVKGSLNNTTSTTSNTSLIKTQPRELESCETDFESLFKRFYQQFASLPVEEKPIKIRKLLRNCSNSESEQISSLLQSFTEESLQRPSLMTAGGDGGCNELLHKTSQCECQICPYQKELEKIDEFYKNFLLLPETSQ